MGYSPKVANITPKCMNGVLRCVHVSVRVRTKRDQARVTGRIGYTPTTIGLIGSTDSS